MNQNARNTIFFLGFTLLSLFVFLYLLGSSTYAVLLSFILAHLSQPLIIVLERYGFSRHGAAISILTVYFLVVALLIILVAPTFISQLSALIEQVPALLDNITRRLQENLVFLGINLREDLVSRMIDNISRIDFFPPVMSAARAVLFNVVNILTFILSLIMIPVFYFFWVEQVDKFYEQFLTIVPRHLKSLVERILCNLSNVFQGYFQGQVVVGITLAVVYATGFTIIRLPYGLVLGSVGGILSAIPYLGAVFVALSTLIVLLAHDTSLSLIIGSVAVLVFGQALESFFLSPRIVGNKVGLNPLQSLFAIIVFANLFGFWGVIVALPLGGAARIIFIELIGAYRKSGFYR
jgi:predicted PurR-regulated permease PerM